MPLPSSLLDSPIWMSVRSVVTVLSCLALLGCVDSSSVEHALDDYRTRLSRVVSVPLPQFADVPRLNYPVFPINGNSQSALTINLREFNAIQHCELGLLIAQRNTTLGKTQLPSQRLIYEQDVLMELSACHARLVERNPELAKTVSRWREMKQGQYQQTWTNMMQLSTEMKAGLSMPKGALGMDSAQGAMASISALTFLTSMSTPSRETTSQEVEAQLQLIYSSRLPAKLWYTQRLLTQQLSALTSELTPVLHAIPCGDGQTSEKATILRNVFYLFFIQQIQPVGSQLNHYHYTLMPVWERWINNQLLSEAFKQYVHTHAITGFSHYQVSMQAHISMWQTFLSRCNLSPQAPT